MRSLHGACAVRNYRLKCSCSAIGLRESSARPTHLAQLLSRRNISSRPREGRDIFSSGALVWGRFDVSAKKPRFIGLARQIFQPPPVCEDFSRISGQFGPHDR